MRTLALTLVPLLILACGQEPAAPDAALPGPRFAAQGAERFTYRVDIPTDWELTPTAFPCLTETIHVTGSFQEHLVAIVSTHI